MSKFGKLIYFSLISRLQEYDLETTVAVIVDGDASLKVDTQHLKLNLRPGSLYQFIGELHIEPNNEVRQLICIYTKTLLAYEHPLACNWHRTSQCSVVVLPSDTTCVWLLLWLMRKWGLIHWWIWIHQSVCCSDHIDLLGCLYFQAILKARVGRNVDGLDTNLYHQTLQLLRQFQAEQVNNQTS